MKEFYEFFNLTTEYCNMKMDADSNWKKHVIKNRLFDEIIRDAIHMNNNVLEWRMNGVKVLSFLGQNQKKKNLFQKNILCVYNR